MDVRAYSSLALIGATVAGLAVASAPANAGPGDEITVSAIKKVGDSHVIEVPFDDLDLSQPSHVRLLKSRLNVAAGRVCSAKLYAPELSSFEQSECFLAALGDANWQLRRASKRAREIQVTGHSAIAPIRIAIRAAF